jgi:hypothetical protein
MSDHEDSTTYDLGWEVVATAYPSTPAAVLDSSIMDDPTYDLGWGDTSSAHAHVPAAQVDAELSLPEDKRRAIE